MDLYNAWRVREGASLCKSHQPSFEMVRVYFMSVLWLLCLVPVLCLLSLMLSYFPSLWCVVLGLYPSSSYRYSCWIADPQHPPGNPKAQLPVEAGHEYLSGCPGAALWTGKGEGGGRSLGSEARDQLRVQLHRVPVQPPGPTALPGPALHDRGSFPVPLCLAHGAPRHAR